jgi:hypothetical protein
MDRGGDTMIEVNFDNDAAIMSVTRVTLGKGKTMTLTAPANIFEYGEELVAIMKGEEIRAKHIEEWCTIVRGESSARKKKQRAKAASDARSAGPVQAAEDNGGGNARPVLSASTVQKPEESVEAFLERRDIELTQEVDRLRDRLALRERELTAIGAGLDVYRSAK